MQAKQQYNDRITVLGAPSNLAISRICIHSGWQVGLYSIDTNVSAVYVITINDTNTCKYQWFLIKKNQVQWPFQNTCKVPVHW